MKNYYDILEVNNKASKFVIDKVYKALAKKYHPDANPDEKKQWAEEKFKEINEAYETLSDEKKRKEYDEKLEKEKNSNDELIANMQAMYDDMVKQNEILKQRINILNENSEKYKTNYYNQKDKIEDNNNYEQLKEKMNNKYYKIYQDAINQAYHDAYIKRMKDYGYRIIYKKSFKEKVKDALSMLIALGITFLLIFILWQIPVVRERIKSILFL